MMLEEERLKPSTIPCYTRSMPGNDDDEISPSDSLRDHLEKRRNQNINQISYRECVQVREVGQIYRDSNVETPADATTIVCGKLGIEAAETQRLLSLYTCICTKPEESVGNLAATVGRKFYGGEGVEELSEEEDRSVDEVRDDIRAFVGSYIRTGMLDEVDLDQSVPDNSFYPYAKMFDSEDFMPFTSITEEFATTIATMPSMTNTIDDFTAIASKQMSEEFTQSLLGSLKPMAEFEESLADTLALFKEEHAGITDEMAADLTAAAKMPTAIQGDQKLGSQFHDLEFHEPRAQELKDRERFEDEGAKAIEQVSNADPDTARDVYRSWWNIANSIAHETSARISPGHLAMIAVFGVIIAFFFGHWGTGAVFLYQVINNYSRISDE
ncbi:hypothetical protein HYG81_26500 (plasmid) [Natrinema zhouii]|uniref:hypothetical protein n=1 Tax=Natrinema zhouii TaxID=1710539 RepID=UPI001CFF7A85|nr:hypothetical protein [Natrinema zhouii]UHQ99185.1 hypothetical protein HYG81_26500 [Natrinema zhouii]